IHSEECLHHLLILIQRVRPKLQVSLPSLSDRVDTPRWAALRSVPGGSDHAILLHLTKHTVECAGVHCAQSERGHFFHQFIPIGTPLPHHQKDNRSNPVLRPSIRWSVL